MLNVNPFVADKFGLTGTKHMTAPDIAERSLNADVQKPDGEIGK